jgi:quercetin dioxygenase-like cupin family protein
MKTFSAKTLAGAVALLRVAVGAQAAYRFIAATMLVAIGGFAAQLALAQPGIGRTEVQRHDLPQAGREVVQVRVDFAPGAGFGAHTHPGEEIAYVLEGTLVYELEGRTIALKAGESLYIPAGAVHAAKNESNQPAAELATYLVDKGKPIVVTK